MANLIVVVILAAMLIGASWYIYKAKKSGKKYAIYSAEAVRKISSVQGLSFEKKVSFTWYMPVVDEVNGVPVVMFRPEKGGAGDES